MLRVRLETGALLHWLPERVEWEAVFKHFEAADYRRPLLVFLLSLNDGGFHSAVPTQGRIDALTAFQQRRIALQARSVAMMRVSLCTVWCAVLLKMQIMEREAGWPRIVKTVRNLLVDRKERQRIAEMLVRGATPVVGR